MNHRKGCEARDFSRTHPVAAHVTVVRCRGCGAIALEQLERDDTHQHTQVHRTTEGEATP